MAVIFPAHYLFVDIENEVVKILKMLNFDISCIHCWMSGIVQSAHTCTYSQPFRGLFKSFQLKKSFLKNRWEICRGRRRNNKYILLL